MFKSLHFAKGYTMSQKSATTYKAAKTPEKEKDQRAFEIVASDVPVTTAREGEGEVEIRVPVMVWELWAALVDPDSVPAVLVEDDICGVALGVDVVITAALWDDEAAEVLWEDETAEAPWDEAVTAAPPAEILCTVD